LQEHLHVRHTIAVNITFDQQVCAKIDIADLRGAVGAVERSTDEGERLIASKRGVGINP
jgi:hypothetical protein